MLTALDVLEQIHEWLEMDPDDVGIEGTHFSRKSVLNRMDRAYRTISNRPAIQRSHHLITTMKIDCGSVNGDLTMPLPANFASLNAIYRIDGNGRRIGTIPVKHVQHNYRYDNIVLSVAIRDGKLLLFRCGGERELEVEYYRVPGTLHYGTVNTATEFSLVYGHGTTVGKVARDYRGDQLRIISGTGEGQVRRIGAFIPSTRTFLLEEPWDDIPDTTSLYGIISFLPENFQDMLLARTASEFAAIPERAAKCMTQYMEMLEDFGRLLTDPDAMTPREVIQTIPGPEWA